MCGMSVSASTLNHTYEIEAELGCGGCGTVYKAWHKRLQKHIVLKELRDGMQKAIEVQRNEIEALKNIKNMYVPQVFDFLTEGKSSFTVMEYVEGEDFDKLLAEGALFSDEQMLRWFQQLATALEELHLNDVCHRDIKPGNIIRKPTGDVCLIDFNSALVSGNNTRVISRSLGYASPEQASYFQICEDANRELRVAQSTDTRHSRPLRKNSIDWKLSDIYSLGATMYHLLNHERPPLRTGNRPLMAERKYPHLRAGLRSIIERCMRYIPAERYASARELRGALQYLAEKSERITNEKDNIQSYGSGAVAVSGNSIHPANGAGIYFTGNYYG